MSLFSFVKNQIAILEVVQAYTSLKQAGHYWKGCCPFHSEKTASFTVSPNKNIFYCFGCQAGGDAIAFIAKIENCSPLEATEFLIERFSLNVPQELLHKDAHKKNQAIETKKQYWDLCAHVAAWCHQQLLRSSKALHYFQQRGIEKPSITTYLLGFFPSGQQSIKLLLEYMKKYNYLLDDLLEANILASTKGTLYSPLEDRIIFPIKDHLGRYCGFGGRVFKENDIRPKYYNSKENPYFLKGSLLFGFDSAKKNIQETNAAFLVEGYLDCIAMVQQGFSNTLATLGTACNLEHLKTLARYCQSLYILFDGDGAGQKAMLRLTELCWQVNLDLKVIRLPLNEDPASFLAKKGNMAELVDQAQDIFLYFIENLGKDFYNNTLSQKMNNTKELLSLIAHIQEPLKRDFLLQTASKAFAVSCDSLRAELERFLPGKKEIILQESKNEDSKTQNGLADQSFELKKITNLEKKLFSVIVNNMQILPNNVDNEMIESFSSPLKDILQLLFVKKRENEALEFADFFQLLDSQQKDITSKVLYLFQTYETPKSFEQLFSQFSRNQWKSKVNILKLQIAKAHKEGNEQNVQKLLSDFQQLKNKFTRGTQ